MLRLILVITLAVTGFAHAQNYPTKTVRLVVPLVAGGPTDLLARLIAQPLGERLGQQVIVDNRPGAGGNIGAEMVAKSPADGYTLFMGTSGPMSINVSIYSKIGYHPARDFAPVVLAASAPFVVVVHPALPVSNIKQLITLIKSKPGQLNFGSPGVGSSPHLTGELFKLITKTDIVHVPYKGNAEAITDLIGGQLSIVFTGVPPVVPLAKAGKVRLLATTGKQRMPNLPEVPTIREAGIEGADVLIWYGVVAPAATPKDVVARLNREIVKIMNTPDVREKFSQQGVDPASSTPDEFAQMIRDEVTRWGKVIRSAGIKLE